MPEGAELEVLFGSRTKLFAAVWGAARARRHGGIS